MAKGSSNYCSFWYKLWNYDGDIGKFCIFLSSIKFQKTNGIVLTRTKQKVILQFVTRNCIFIEGPLQLQV